MFSLGPPNKHGVIEVRKDNLDSRLPRNCVKLSLKNLKCDWRFLQDIVNEMQAFHVVIGTLEMWMVDEDIWPTDVAMQDVSFH